MKNLFGVLALFVSAILFMGCPYNSEVPLSAQGAKITDNYIGTWEMSDTEGTKIEVKRGASNQMEIVKTEAGYDGGEPTITKYFGHFTDIKGTLFLNVKEDSEYSSYYFYKISPESDFKMMLIPVTANIREKFTNSDEQKAFFEKNMQNSYFYDTGEETYYKIK